MSVVNVLMKLVDISKRTDWYLKAFLYLTVCCGMPMYQQLNLFDACGGAM
jgi:hypothetical protein